jgi:hypothetical protein
LQPFGDIGADGGCIAGRRAARWRQGCR